MALTDAQLEIISDALLPLFHYLESEVITDVANRIKHTMAYTRTAEIEVEQMQALGYSPAKIRKEAMQKLKADTEFRKEVAKNTLEHKKKVKELLRSILKAAKAAGDEILEKTANLSYMDDLRIWKEGGKELTEDSFLPQLVEAVRQQTFGDFCNLTRTTGFKNMYGYESIENLYQRELDKALIKVSSGVFSREKVVYDVVHNLASSGLRSIDFESGYSMQLDTAVKLAVRTGAHQLAGRIMDENIKQTRESLIYVSKHWGARNKGSGHQNHEEWQGKVYYIGEDLDYSDEAKRIGLKKIESLWEKTGYSILGDKENDPLGLYGYNCRHKHYPWFPGVSDFPTDDPEPNPVVIDGKTYDYYAISQKMRAMERKIRELKREREALKALNMDTTQVKKKISQKKREYQEFCDLAKVKPDWNRIRYEKGSSDLKKTKAWQQYEGIVSDKNSDIIEPGNKSKAIDRFILNADEQDAVYSKQSIFEELQTSEIGLDTINHIENGKAVILLNNEKQLHDFRGYQIGNEIEIFLQNISSKVVAAQTIIHEMAHLHYNIGLCQHAEAVCYAMEKMHIAKRKYITEEEWDKLVNLAKDNYPELEWEEGGYGDYGQFDFIRKEVE